MKLGHGDINFEDYWVHSKKHGSIVIDTCVLSKIVKKEEGAHDVLEHLKQSGWCIFMPTPVLFEIGFGRESDVPAVEKRIWKILMYSNPKFSSLSNETTVIELALKNNGNLQFTGEITHINPDPNNWFAAKTMILKRLEADKNLKSQKAKSEFVDGLILATARNIFSGIWTDNPTDFIRIQTQGSWEWSRSTPKRLLPIFSTSDFLNAINGSQVSFPTSEMMASISDKNILTDLEEYKKIYCTP